MRIDDFDFDLPEDRIALHPTPARDGARLLHVSAAGMTDRQVTDLPTLFNPGDMLVVNNTRVLPAQLQGVRPARAKGGGGPVTIDVTLHKRVPGGADAELWRAFVRPAKRLAVGDQLDFGAGLSAEIDSRDGAEAQLRFNCNGPAFRDGLAAAGAPPLPPYIARKRALTDDDEARYQTIYAEHEGSVAAPTAGLHFTDALFEALAARGVLKTAVTLHVGAGTFLPVSVDDTDDHQMHAEEGIITAQQADAINAARARGRRIIAVGTTSLRLLESASDDAGIVHPFRGETDIFITPGYRFKAIDGLVTNFHLPRSTLFMLVSALAGLDEMKRAYAHAIDNGYRFYSYGDACFLERKNDR